MQSKKCGLIHSHWLWPWFSVVSAQGSVSNQNEWLWLMQDKNSSLNDNYWSFHSFPDSEKETRQAKPFIIVFVTNHSHPFPASCSSLSHKCCLLSVNFRRENKAKSPVWLFIFLDKITLLSKGWVLNLGTIDIGDQIILCCSVHCSIFSSTPDLYSGDASSNLLNKLWQPTGRMKFRTHA